MAGVAAFSLSPGRNFGSTFFAPNFGDRPPGEDRLLRLQNFVLACNTQVGLYGGEFLQFMFLQRLSSWWRLASAL
jgi:hypothetical protein